MTNQPNPDDQPTPATRSHPWRRRLRRYGIPIGGVLLAGLAGGAWWGWVFVNEQLSPLIEKNLSEALKRPVKLGRVERFSLTSLRVGPSSVPATEKDTDQLSIAAIEVGFNPLKILFNRSLNLGITVERPSIYLEQDKDGTWISTAIQQKEEEGPVKTDIESVRFQDAEVVLVPWAKYGDKRGIPVKLGRANGVARFFDNGGRITYDLSAETNTGGKIDISGESLRKPEQTNLELRAQNFLVSEVDRLVKLPVDLQAGRANATIAVQFRPEDKQPKLKGTAQFNGVTLKIPQVPTKFQQASGTLRLDGTLLRLENVNTLYGTVPVLANGDIDTAKGFKLTALVKPVGLDKIIESLAIAVPVPVSGEVRADLTVNGPIDKPILTGITRSTKPSRIDQIDLDRFSADFKLDAAAQLLTLTDVQATPTAGGQVSATGRVTLSDKPTIAIVAQAENVVADPIVRAYAGSNAPPFSLGLVNAQAQITGPADALVVTIPTARITPGIGGTVTASGQIRLGETTIVALNTQVENLPADPIVQAYAGSNAPPFSLGLVNAQAQINGPIDALVVTVPTAQVNPGIGGTVTAAGQIALGGQPTVNLTAQVADLPGDPIVQAYAGSNAPPFSIGRVNAQAQITGRTDALLVNLTNSQINPGIGGSITTTGQISLAGSPSVDLTARVNQVPADPLVKAYAGNLTTASLGRVNGTARIAGAADSLVVTVPGVQLNPATGGILTAAGLFEVARSRFDFNVRANDFDLQTITLPVPVQYSGRTDFAARITGTPTAPTVAADLSLKRFTLNGVAFEPLLRGNLRVDRGVALNLTGQQDRIALTLGADYLPIAFDLRRGDAIATGRTQGELLAVTLQQFPLSLVNPPGTAALFPVSGEVSGTIALNVRQLRTPSQLDVNGQLSVINPAIGGFRGDQFGGQITLRNGIATLQNAELRRGSTILQINTASAAVFAANPNVDVRLSVTQGRLQDVLQFAQLFNLSDLSRGARSPVYGDALDLQTSAIALENASILDRIRRLSEIKALQAQIEARRRESPLPELSELDGRFNAAVNVTGSLRTGLNATFKLEGEEWKWGSFFAKTVLAQGSFENGTLSLLPLEFKSDDSLIAFTGQLSATQQSGQLRVVNVPIESLTALVPVPIDIEGKLNATATLSGNLENPQTIGSLQLNNGIINGTDIREARGSFRYENARLAFGSTILLQSSEPLSITGSIPQQLPFARVSPDSNEVRLDINVKNEGLAFLNVLNNQVAWENGLGQVNLQVRGTLETPIATGAVNIQNATIRAKALPEPLTGVTGSILFDRDRIRVASIQGQYAGRGQVIATGVLPLSQRLQPGDADLTKPLQVGLEKLTLTLKGLYSGGVGGNVEVAGTAFNPVISGLIRLSDGQVQIASDTPATPPAATPKPGATTSPAETTSEIEFSNLKIQLGDRISVVRQPVLNFVAAGDLTINGTLDEPRPSGTIRLTAGQINLFTTQFNLVRGYPQTAIFSPEQGTDPTLNVRLVAVVPESRSYRQPTTILSSEVLDTPPPSATIGGVQSVQIQADVQGRASQIFDGLKLTSRPARSDSEIIALIGGSFVSTLGQGGDGTLGLVNLAGSALLTNVQTTIGNVLGLSEFRLFPTQIQDTNRSQDERRSRRAASSLGIGIQGAIDLSPVISVSALGIIGANQPPQFGLRYRLSDQFILRGSSDFSGDNQGVLEYETRF